MSLLDNYLREQEKNGVEINKKQVEKLFQFIFYWYKSIRDPSSPSGGMDDIIQSAEQRKRVIGTKLGISKRWVCNSLGGITLDYIRFLIAFYALGANVNTDEYKALYGLLCLSFVTDYGLDIEAI